MREILFRFYDRDKKEMIYQSDNTCSCLNGLEYFCQLVGQVKGYTPEIQQYTGLKDKNGNEIYEGDIVVFSSSWDNKDWKDVNAKIGFLEGKFCVLTDNGEYLEEICNCCELEVVGNKFENPELLKI